MVALLPGSHQQSQGHGKLAPQWVQESTVCATPRVHFLMTAVVHREGRSSSHTVLLYKEDYWAVERAGGRACMMGIMWLHMHAHTTHMMPRLRFVLCQALGSLEASLF
jgi:hypothetical protein